MQLLITQLLRLQSSHNRIKFIFEGRCFSLVVSPNTSNFCCIPMLHADNLVMMLLEKGLFFVSMVLFQLLYGLGVFVDQTFLFLTIFMLKRFPSFFQLSLVFLFAILHPLLAVLSYLVYFIEPFLVGFLMVLLLLMKFVLKFSDLFLYVDFEECFFFSLIFDDFPELKVVIGLHDFHLLTFFLTFFTTHSK